MTKAAIIGSGPNGLSAAIALARAGIQTRVYEARDTIGGAASTGEITLPGFQHDLGSSIFPMAAASPFFQSLPLAEHGLRWIEPPAPLAHPLDDGTAVMLEHDIAATAANLDATGHDGRAYTNLLKPLVEAWPALCQEILGPVLHLPSHPLLMARFGLYAAPARYYAREKSVSRAEGESLVRGQCSTFRASADESLSARQSLSCWPQQDIPPAGPSPRAAPRRSLMH